MRLPRRLQGQKVKSQGHGAGAYCGGHLAAQLVIIVIVMIMYKTCLWVCSTDDVRLGVVERTLIAEISLFERFVVDETPLIRTVRVELVRPTEILYSKQVHDLKLATKQRTRSRSRYNTSTSLITKLELTVTDYS